MKFTKVFFLFSLLFIGNLEAKNPVAHFTMPQIAFESEFGCNLPAPANLHITIVGADWIEVTWPAVFGASQYKLQAFDGASGFGLGAPVTVSSSTLTTVLSTSGNNGTVYAKVWTVCGNGELSASPATSETVDTVIIELVASGFTYPTHPETDCTVGTGYANGCEVSWNSTNVPFLVRYSINNNSYSKRFDVEVDDYVGRDYVNIIPDPYENGPNNIYFSIGSDDSADNTHLAVFYRANTNETDTTRMTILERLSAARPTANGSGRFFKLTAGAANCLVTKVKESLPRGMQSSLAESVVATPNPFTSAIRIQLPETKDPTGTTLHLYDLQGAKKMSYRVPADQPECTLNTSQLEPGVYFIRIETEGKVETIKVVK